jgi:hypothetical protein
VADEDEAAQERDGRRNQPAGGKDQSNEKWVLIHGWESEGEDRGASKQQL